MFITADSIFTIHFWSVDVGNIIFSIFSRTKYSSIDQKIILSRILLTDAVHGDTVAVHVGPPPVLRIISSHRHGHAGQTRGGSLK